MNFPTAVLLTDSVSSVAVAMGAMRRLDAGVCRGAKGKALRWGQPSYITGDTGSGSTIRIEQIKREPTKYSTYFICTSDLIDIFKDHHEDEMHFVGNRSIVFDIGDRLPEDALRHCISLALTQYFRKRAKP